MISIIIPTLTNVNGLKNLLYYLKKIPYEIIIIDNQPNDQKMALIKKIIKKNLHYYPQKKNLGFAKAVNLGAKQAQSQWLLILNDDIELPPKINLSPVFNKIINFANANNLVAISPVLKDKKGRIENVGYQVLPYGKVKLIKKIEDQDQYLDGLTAACLFVRKDVFSKVGGFDSRFFAYLEDVDFFLTLKEKGYRFGIYEKFSVVHNQMTTGKTLSWRKNWHDFKNWILIILKHPKKFRLNYQLFIERLKNLWGVIKNIKN